MKLNYNYIKDNTFAPAVLTIDGRQVHNPTEAMYLAQGYTKVVPHTPTEEEIAEQAKQQRIAELKMLLADSDYKAIKYAEGWLTGDEYAATKAQRQAWRDEINQLESDVDND